MPAVSRRALRADIRAVPVALALAALAQPVLAAGKRAYALPATFPMLHIVVDEPVANLCVWEAIDGEQGRLIFNSFAYWQRWHNAKDHAARRHRDWLVRLDHAPERILVRQEGEGEVEGTVTALSIVSADGEVIHFDPSKQPTVDGARATTLPFPSHQLNLFEFAFPKARTAHLRDEEASWPPMSYTQKVCKRERR